MPKVLSSRKFLKSVRQSASPLAANGNGLASAVSIANQAEFADMKSPDLIAVIKERLNHGLPSERCIGTDMIATFLTDKRLTQLKPNQVKEIIGMLGALLLDRAENVRFGAIDALCYLSSVSDKMCALLVQCNILQHIMAMLEAHFLPIVSWTQPKVTDKKLTLNINVDCFNLLTNLCCVSSQFVDSLLSHTQFVKVMRKAFQTFGPYEKISFVPIAIAAAQCLAVICEDDAICKKLIDENNGDNQNLFKVMNDIARMELSSITDPANVAAHQYLQSLIISTACCHHFKSSMTASKLESTIQTQWFLGRLQQEINQLFSEEGSKQLQNLLVGQLQELMSEDMSSEIGSLARMTCLYEQVKYRYLAKRNFFELLTNLLAPNDDENEESEDNTDDDDETEAMDQQDSAANSNCDPVLLKFCHENSLLKYLLNELASTPSVDEQIFEKHVYGREIISTIQTTKLSALTLTHNLIASRIITKEEPLLAQLWQCVYAMAFKSNTVEEDELELEVHEEAINVVREFITTFTEMNCLTMDDLEKLVSLSAGQQSDSISHLTKVNIVRIMAAVASRTVAHHCRAPTEPMAMMLESITSMLISGLCSPNSDLVLRAEILDSLMDIFADDNELTTTVCKRINLLGTLGGIAGMYRKELKANTRIVKQNAVVSTVGLNLNRFIKYKKKVV